jgi:DNA gyrase subunit A
MKDNIIQIDSRKSYMENMARYSLYILYNRYVPDIRDGLKPVQRRIIYAMWNDVKCTSIASKRKSANTVGTVIAKYHSHGDSSVYGAMKPMTNWFEIKQPLLVYDSNSGSLQGGPQAAMRYTESYLSKFTMDCVIGDMVESRQVVDWQNTFDNHTIEPESLPVKVPLLLINGIFGIVIGRRIEVPHHSLNDVIDATIAVLHDPKAKVVLIPDPCQKCEIIDTDWKKICNSGFGYFTERGIIETTHDDKKGIDTLHIKSVPDLIFSDSIVEKIEELIKENKLVQISDIQDHSTEEELDIRLILKKGSDPNYVKHVLYSNTSLEETKRVNMEVIDGTEIKRISYKAYIAYFIEYRRSVKFRLYNFRIQKAETRLHQIDTYIKILESGDVENIVHMIRNQSSMEESYLVNWLMKKLKITDLQAKFVLHTEIGRLSKGHLQKYKAEQKALQKDVANFINIVTHEEIIDQEIENELLEIKAKYGRPRRSIIVSESDANNVPGGTVKVVVTENNFIKKLQLNDNITAFKGDQPKCVIVGDNSKDILLFDQMGKVFRLQINKIPFTDKHSPGLDIRMILKKLTSNIISMMYLPIIEELNNKTSPYFMVTVSKQRLIKRIDLGDIINTTPSGIIYSKLNAGDMVCDILIAGMKSDIIVYTKSKALRIPLAEVPYQKRSTLGNLVMKTNDTIDGISVITSATKDVVVITANGRFNRINQSALPRSQRNKAGSRVIKLGKGDYIMNIFSCHGDDKILRVIRPDEVVMINVNDIPEGSSVSTGAKLCKSGIIKVELINKDK